MDLLKILSTLIHTLISFRLISIGSGASETLFVMVKSLVLLAILGNKK